MCRYTETQCQHKKPCLALEKAGHCSYLCRQQRVDVLHGSLLHAWDTILEVSQRCMCDDPDKDNEEDEGKCAAATAPRHSNQIYITCFIYRLQCPRLVMALGGRQT